MMTGALTEPTFSSFSIRSLGRGIQFLTPISVREATIKKVFNRLRANKIVCVFLKSTCFRETQRTRAQLKLRQRASKSLSTKLTGTNERLSRLTKHNVLVLN
jgi:hypothetical protein